MVSLLAQAFPALGVTASDVAVKTPELIKAPLAGSTAPAPQLFEFVYTIVLQGVLSGLDVSQLLGAAIGGATAVVSTVADGGVGCRVDAGGTLALDLGSASGQTVTGVALQLNGNGNGGVGALENISGDNTWQGPAVVLTPKIPAITLSSSSAIGVATGTTLTVGPDANNTPPIAGLTTAALTKVGPGTLSLPTANSYEGNTYIKNGVLSIADSNALGAASSNEVQTLTFTGSLNGTFTLKLGATVLGTNISADYTAATTTQTITNATESGNVVTITTSTPLVTAIGQQVIISAVKTVGYDGTFVVTAVSGNTFSYDDSTTSLATDTGGGTATAPNTLAELITALTGIATVTQSATNQNVFTITFDQPGYAGNKQPLLGTTPTAGTTVTAAEVIQGGLGGTIVNPAPTDTGTLELTGSITFSSGEVLTLNGAGFNPNTGEGRLLGRGSTVCPAAPPRTPGPIPPSWRAIARSAWSSIPASARPDW